MTLKPEPSLEQCLPEGQLVNRVWLLARGFNRPNVDYALRAGKLETVAHGVYRRPGPPPICEGNKHLWVCPHGAA